jgi:hypothetical protein
MVPMPTVSVSRLFVDMPIKFLAFAAWDTNNKSAGFGFND